MRVLHVISSIDPKYGGPNKYILDLVSTQNNKNIESHLLTVSNNVNYDIQFYKKYKNLKNKCFIYKTNISHFINFSLNFVKYVKKNLHTYDLIHIHGLYRFPVTYVSFKARKLNIPYIIRPHGSLDPYLYNQSSKSIILKKLWEYLFDIPNIKFANGIHCTSSLEKAKINHLDLVDKTKLFIVQNFVSDSFKKKKKILSFKKKMGYSKDEKVILFLGRINFKKGLDILIPAFTKIHKIFPNYKLLLVGQNNEHYLENVVLPLVKKNKIEESFNYLPPVYDNKLSLYYQNCDIFVLPSYSENFGLTIFEAMASNIPVVISDQIDLASKIKKNKLAFIHKCNVNSLYNKIKSCIENKHLTNQNKQRAYNFVKKNYTKNLVVYKLNRIYKKILSNHLKLN